MRSPRKSELLRLQSLYQTDARIAEVLAVPEYLVGYWRRKKGLPRYNAPKFSREQIVELWERYADDFRCGRELNISKAAYYSWRRRYDILDKPAVLKLEQLELRLAGPPEPDTSPTATTAKTGTQKIRDRCRLEYPGSDKPSDWQLSPAPDGAPGVFALSPGPDHAIPRSAPVAEALPRAEIQQPVWIADAYGSIEWQLVEACAVFPGQLVVGPCGLAAGLGGVGVLYLDPASAKQPQRKLRIELTRKLGPKVDIEDIVITLLERQVNADWNDAVIELLGVPIERLLIDQKVKLCSLLVHFGAVAALCPFDDPMRRHYGRLLRRRFPQCHPDRTAAYDGEHFVEGRNVGHRCVATMQNEYQVIVADESQRGGVIIGPGALPYEIEITADIVRGRRIGSDQSLLVCPATPDVYRLSQRRGWTDTIVAAGGSVLDLSLIRRMGVERLLDIAIGKLGLACITRPISGFKDENIRFAGVRTAIEQLHFQF